MPARSKTREQLPFYLHRLAQLAAEQGQELYLVGGAVRDWLLGQRLADVDLMCDRSAQELARGIEVAELGTVQSRHDRFGTAKIKLRGERNAIDLATARRETYAYPGALPDVYYPVDVREDLKRRDFTFNAIAYRLRDGEFVDPFQGQHHLREGSVRVLHPLSYWEDPTRMIRAVRFATRFGYDIPASERGLMAEAFRDERLLAMSSRLRGARIGIELQRLLELSGWLEGAAMARELSIFELCRPGLGVRLASPPCELETWDCRLAWLLGANRDFEAICKELAMKARDLQNLRTALNPGAVSWKGCERASKLPYPYRCLLEALHPEWETALRVRGQLEPAKLRRQGWQGKDLADELERRFQELLLAASS